MRYDLDLSDWRLALADGIVRVPPRNRAMRSARFEDRYDTRTVIYDVFWDADGESVTAVTAPLLNLASALAVTATALPSGAPCPLRHEEWPKFDRLVLQPPPGTVALAFETPLGRVVRAIQPNLGAAFDGAKMIYTLQKDNDLVWIRDWAQFYVREHGADTAVVYDNGSTRYETAEIANVLDAVDGLGNVVVLPWTFPYGAFDLREERSLNCIDGIFCQVAAFHHVRWRLAGRANGFVNVDIDELVARAGERTLFDALAASDAGYIEFAGFWVENVRAAAGDDDGARRHRDYHFCTAPRPTPAETKWAVVPSRLPRDAYLSVHKAGNVHPSPATDLTLFHFKGINVKWDVDRAWHAPRSVEFVAGEGFASHPLIRAALERSFAGDDAAIRPTRPSAAADEAALVARLKSARALGEGARQQAIDFAELAVAIDPAMPSYLEHLAGLTDDGERAAALRVRSERLREADAGFHFQSGERAYMEGRVDDAVDGLKRCLVLDPGHPPALKRLLHLLQHLERHDEAEAIVRHHLPLTDAPDVVLEAAVGVFARRRRWGDLEALVEGVRARNLAGITVDPILAMVLIRQHRTAEAREALDRAWKTVTPAALRARLGGIQHGNRFVWPSWRYEPARGELHLLEAEIATAEGRLADAAAWTLEGARRLYPHGTHPLLLAAKQLRRLGRAEEAAEALTAAIEICRRPHLTSPPLEHGPIVAELWRGALASHLAQALLLSGDEAEAGAVIEGCRDEPRVLARVLRSAAETYGWLGEPGKAAFAAHRLTEIAPDDAQAFLLLAKACLERGDPDGARRAAERALALDGAAAADVDLILARVATAQGDHAAAAARCRAVLGREPAREDTRLLLVRSLLASGAPDEALGVARTAVEHLPGLAANHVALADALVALGRNGEAIDVLAAARAALPPAFPIAHGLVRELTRAGRDGEAEPVAREVVALRPDWAPGRVLLARILAANGDRAGAIEAQQAAVALSPDDGAYHRLLARFLFDDRRLDEASAAATEAVRLGDEPARHLLARIEDRRAAAPQVRERRSA